MKKTYLIIAGIVSVLLLLAIWLYLLIFGTPKPVEDFFTDFSFAPESPISTDPIIAPDQNPTVDIEGNKLRQLTTKPVIGYSEFIDGENSYMRYVEAGTGHIFNINLITGEESRISNATINQPESAKFSDDGRFVVIRSGYTTLNSYVLIEIENNTVLSNEKFTALMVDYDFSTNGELLFTTYSNDGLEGRSYDLGTKLTKVIFKVPFQSATVVWSKDENTPHYVYPKATSRLNGYLYSIKNGTVNREKATGNGLMAMANNSYIIYTNTLGGGPTSFIYKKDSDEVNGAAVVINPHKCAFSKTSSSILYCGNEEGAEDNDYPDNWLRGEVSFKDSLWEIDLSGGPATGLVEPEVLVGRELDVINLTVGNNSEVLYFNNKSDNTLWMYEI